MCYCLLFKNKFCYTSYFQMACHVSYTIQIGSMTAVVTKIFCKALLSEMKQDLPWMERLTLIMCTSMHRKEIHRHLTLKGQTLEPNSPSGQHSVVMVEFWGLTFLMGMWTAWHIYAWTSLLFCNLPYTLTINFGRDYFEVFGGHKMALQLITSLKSGIASMRYSERIVSLRFNIMWNGHLARRYLKNKMFTTPPENIDVLC